MIYSIWICPGNQILEYVLIQFHFVGTLESFEHLFSCFGDNVDRHILLLFLMKVCICRVLNLLENPDNTIE